MDKPDNIPIGDPAMKVTQWKRAVRPLIPQGEHWEFSTSLCYRAPVSRFMFGILGEGSDFDTGVYIWRVSMPLFVSSDIVDLSYSKRIEEGAKKYYFDDVDALTAAIASGFRNLPTEDNELHRIIKMASRSRNTYVLEAAACSQIILGDRAGALDTIKRVNLIPSPYEWENKLLSRVVDLRRTLEEKGLEATALEIDAQAKRTASVLGLVHE
ncbi:MAG TPA: hypothetical protein VF444_02045 [Pseudonocardiaceae bacterium]